VAEEIGPGAAQRPPAAGSSIDRALAILDLFTSRRLIWSIEMLMEELGLSRTTTYRYVRSLAAAGYLVATAGGGYALGPRFIEMDRRIRLGDPLQQIAPPILAANPRDFLGAQILSGFYGDRAVSIYVDHADPELTLSMERGRSFPLLAGPPSRVILAHLPAYQLRNLLAASPGAVAQAGLGTTWAEFSASLRAIRRRGHEVAGDFSPAVIAAAAPVFRAPGVVIASLCLVRRKALERPGDTGRLVAIATATAARISDCLQAQGGGDGTAGFPAPRLRRPAP